MSQFCGSRAVAWSVAGCHARAVSGAVAGCSSGTMSGHIALIVAKHVA